MNIKKDFPKSYEKLKQWMLPKLIEMRKQFSEGVIDEEEKIQEMLIEQFTDAMLQADIRLLYDFFDDNELFITIDFVQLEGNKSWYCEIADNEIVVNEYLSRKQAELEGFKKCFEIMEK